MDAGQALGRPDGGGGWWRGYAEGLAAVALATALGWVLFPYAGAVNVIMTYLLAVVVVATRQRRGPAALAALAGVAAFDFLFVPPYFTLGVADPRYLLTFPAMLVVALVISTLTTRLRGQAEAARARERQTAALAAMSAALMRASTREQVAGIAARHFAEVFDAELTLFVPDGRGGLAALGRTGQEAPGATDRAHATEAFAQRRPVLGAPGARDRAYLPLPGEPLPLGVAVLRVRRSPRLAEPEGVRRVEAFLHQLALALERVRLAEEAQSARVRAETERLRSALLASVSHDLRTPLATITGAATALLEGDQHLGAPARRDLLEAIREESERLNRLVQNLLQMTRLESGTLELRRGWHSLEEVVGAALRRLARTLATRSVIVTVPPDLPLVAIDDVLVEQVLVNLLENAAKHTPPGRPIRILATAAEGRVTVEVADRGPGVPPGEEERIFEKFYRGSTTGRGAGLGLAICRGIVEAHGGRIWAQNLPEGGLAVLFTLPLAPLPATSVPADA